MALVIADRVKETTTTTGTGTINLSGASAGFQTFVAGVGTGNTTYYCITSGTDWEVGIGTVTDATPDTLSRTTILASSNSGSAISLTGTSIVFGTNPANLIKNSGLYGGTFIAGNVGVPTSASTGLTTWVNQGGATVTDTPNGVLIFTATNAGDSWRLRTKTAPGTPYTITALVSHTAIVNFAFTGIGWYDGTKLHGIYIGNQLSTQTRIQVGKWTSATVFSANDFTGADGVVSNPIWLQIQDDGTNVKFRYGHNGSTGSNSDLVEVFSVAKASGWLGSTGYSNVWFGHDNNNTGKNGIGVLMAWIQS